MMPMQTERYPVDWIQIANEIKEANGWICQQCGQQCRKPGESFDSHKRTLTIAHLMPGDHAPDAPVVFVAALCAPCHIRIDNARRQAQREAAKPPKPTLFSTPQFWGEGFDHEESV